MIEGGCGVKTIAYAYSKSRAVNSCNASEEKYEFWQGIARLPPNLGAMRAFKAWVYIVSAFSVRPLGLLRQSMVRP